MPINHNLKVFRTSDYFDMRISLPLLWSLNEEFKIMIININNNKCEWNQSALEEYTRSAIQ